MIFSLVCLLEEKIPSLSQTDSASDTVKESKDQLVPDLKGPSITREQFEKWSIKYVEQYKEKRAIEIRNRSKGTTGNTKVLSVL